MADEDLGLEVVGLAQRRVNSAHGVAQALRAWDRLVIEQAASAGPLPVGASGTGSVLLPGATEAQLSRCERRLGHDLPPSYRTFLSLSNGAYAGPDGVTTGDEERAVSAMPGLALCQVDEVRPLAEVDPDLLRIWVEAEYTAGAPSISFDGDRVEDYRAMRRGALVIGGFDLALTLLVRVGRGREWQMWSLYWEGATGWRSFGSWLDLAAFGETVPPLRELLPAAADGDRQASDRLTRALGSATVAEIVDAMADYPRLRYRLMGALGAVDTDEAAAVLERFLQQPRPRASLRSTREQKAIDWSASPYREEREHAHLNREAISILGRMKCPEATDLLVRYGACDVLAHRGDSRAGAIAAHALDHDLVGAGVGAVNALATHGDPNYLPQLHREHARLSAWTPDCGEDVVIRGGQLASVGVALARLGDPAGVDVLRDLVESGFDQARPLLDRYEPEFREPPQDSTGPEIGNGPRTTSGT